jgi:Bacterial SH3 domain
MKYPSSLLLIIVLAGVLACNSEKKPEPANAMVTDVAEPYASKDDFKAADQAWVHAGKGLTLRETADPKGKPLGLIPYGDEVKILTAATSTHAYAAEQYAAWQLDGHWIKVEAIGKTGYVFDAYLAPFPTLAEEPEADRELLEWFYHTLADFKGPKVSRKPDPSKGLVEGSYTQYFADGARFELELYEGGVSQYLHIPGSKMSLGRALVVFRSLIFQAAKEVRTNWSEEEKALTLSSPEDAFAYFQLNIEEKEGKIIISALTAD